MSEAGHARRGSPGGAGKPSFRKALGVFRYPVYRWLYVSSAVAFVGMQMQQVARALLAWDLTHSFGAVGAVSLSFGLPMLAFSLVGGSLADRWDRRNLTLATQAATSLLALLSAILVATDVITFQMLFLLGLAQGTFSALGMPARTPMMAESVPQSMMMSAIAMSQTAMNATRLVGPALAGAIVGLWGIDAAYFAQAGLYAVAAATILTLPKSTPEAIAARRARQGSMFQEIANGVRYVAGDAHLRLLMGMMFVLTFFAMPYVMLLAGFVQRDLGRGPGSFGVLQSVSGLGALLGSIGIAALAEYERKPLVQWAAGIVGGGGLILLAAASLPFGYGGAIAAVLVLGLSMTAYQTLNSTMVMDAARPEFYGRVMSINMLTFSAMPLMAYPLGEVADVAGARETFVAQGLIVLSFMLLVAVVSPRRTFGRAVKLTMAREIAARVGGRGEAQGLRTSPSAVPASGGDDAELAARPLVRE